MARSSSSTRRSSLLAAVRQAGRFDRSAIDWPGGLMAAIPVIAVLGIPIAAGDPVTGVTMGAGAMLVGIAWRVRGGRPPVGAMALDSLLMAVATFVGCVSGSFLWIHLVVLCLVSLFGGLLVGIGNRGGVIGNQAVIAVVVFGRFSEPASQAAGIAGLVLAGGCAQVVFQSLIRWPSPLRTQREATAAAYRALAAFAGADLPGAGMSAATNLDGARETLAAPALFGDQAVVGLRSLVDEGYRIRVALTTVHTLAARLGPTTAAAVAAGDALRRAVTALDLAGRVLVGDLDRTGELAAAVGAVTRRVDAARHDGAFGEGDGAAAAILGRRLAALAGQLRAAGSLAGSAARDGGLRSRRPRGPFDRPLREVQIDLWRLRQDLRWESPIGRHALRLAVIVPAMELIAQALPVSRGYWLVVAAAAVLRPEYGATFTRGSERVIGTSLGVGIAGLIAATLHPGGAGTVVLVGVFAWLAYATFPGGFAAGFTFITALVVFLLNAIDPDTLATAGARLLDTLIGGTLGLLAYAAWPTWSAIPAREALATLVGAERRYLSDVLGAYVDGASALAAEIRQVSRELRLARVNAESTIARSLSEPSSRQIDRDEARGALDALLRLARATHVLRLDGQDRSSAAPMPVLAPLAGAIDGALAVSETALRDGVAVPDSIPDARAAYDALIGIERGLGGDLAAELDEVVDAADTLLAALSGGSSGVGPSEGDAG